MSDDPLVEFAQWFNAALAAEIPEANAMTLATVDAQGKPHARMVLLKGFDQNGFYFFTNYGSAKAGQLTDNPQAALVLFWAGLRRQIRIEGRVEKISRQASEEYFRTRPRGSQISAHVSSQSQEIASREILEIKAKQLSNEYEGKEIPLPLHWGGYCLRPTLIEFWQGQPHRLHDRLVFYKQENSWHQVRLAP